MPKVLCVFLGLLLLVLTVIWCALSTRATMQLGSTALPVGLSSLKIAGVPLDAEVHTFDFGRGYNDCILARNIAPAQYESIIARLGLEEAIEADEYELREATSVLQSVSLPTNIIQSRPSQMRVAHCILGQVHYRSWYDPATKNFLISHYGPSR